MKISKKATHIICGFFEIAFAIVAALKIYFVAESINIAKRMDGFYLSHTLCSYSADIILPLLLLAATIIIHVFMTKPPRNEEQIEAKKREQKQKRIDQLQAELDELNKTDR